MIFQSQKDFISYISKLHSVFNIFGLDVGNKKIGIASGNSLLKIATPVKVIPNDISTLKKYIKDYEIHGLVLGISDNKDSSSHKMIEKFAKKLSEAVELPITFEDEKYTTIIANELLKEAGMNRKRRNEIDDMIAAQIILDSFFKKLP